MRLRRKHKRYKYLSLEKQGETWGDNTITLDKSGNYKPFYFGNLGSQGWRYVGQDTDSQGTVWYLFEKEVVG